VGLSVTRRGAGVGLNVGIGDVVVDGGNTLILRLALDCEGLLIVS
jgi:hypothetical protein